MHLPSYISTEFPIGQNEKLQLNKRFPTVALAELYVDAQTLGNLMVYFDAGDEARVMAIAEEHLLPERVELVDKRLVIEAKNFREFLKKGQAEKIRIEVHVPERTRLNIACSNCLRSVTSRAAAKTPCSLRSRSWKVVALYETTVSLPSLA